MGQSSDLGLDGHTDLQYLLGSSETVPKHQRLLLTPRKDHLSWCSPPIQESTLDGWVGRPQACTHIPSEVEHLLPLFQTTSLS